METVMNLIFENIQEKDLIQNNRKECEKLVKEIVTGIDCNDPVEAELLSDQLFSLMLQAEKAGFCSGFFIGNQLEKEIQMYRNK